MAPVFLPAIDFKTFESESKGLSPKELAYLGHVFTEVSADSIDEACSYLQRTFSNFASYVEVTGLDSVEDVIDLLHAGASKVFVSEAQLDQLLKIKDVDFDRVFLQLTAAPESAPVLAKKAIDTGCGGVYFRDLKAWRKSQSGNQAHLAVKYVALERPTPEELKSSEARSNIPVISATALTTDIKANPSLMPVSEWLLANASSDRPDGLLSTVVTDERGVALGFVYSSKESISESLRTGTGVYQSRKRGLWYKGATSGDTQQLVRIDLDCDQDCIRFVVRQEGRGFCHLGTATCFGQYAGLSRLQQTLQSRKASAPEGSYTARLFNSPQLLRAKIMEEAEELCDATSKDNIAFEAADLIYFALTKCVAAGVSLEDVEKSLDAKSVKVKRRKGDAKGQWAAKEGLRNGAASSEKKEAVKEAASVPKAAEDSAGTEDGKIHMKRYITAKTSQKELDEALQRPSQRSSETIMGIVNPIIKNVRDNGDAALLDYTHKFEKATSLTSPVIRAPFPKSMMQLPAETIHAIDVSFENIRKFHAGQKDKPLTVETMPGVVCSRFSRPIERVGLYIPGGTAVLPSTALMLGVPAMVAGCKKIVLASPPRADGSVTPEIVYVAHKVGAESIVLAGGAQAVAALAYGTESVSKVDKILGPGNQFVTAGKMVVSNDTTASVSIDMPAGPSEVLVIADETANPAFVASDLLSQAEHGVDSQVILIAVNLTEAKLAAIEEQVHLQASALPRVDIVRGSINHSITLVVKDINEAMTLSNKYAPEHLILQVQNAEKVVDLVENAGSVFIGPWTPESVGDYSAGVNHSLPTYGYAKQYSGVNLGSYLKHITSSNLTAEGLKNVGGAVMQLAKVEELEAHRRAVSIRLEHMSKVSS